VQEGLLDLCFLIEHLIVKDMYKSFTGSSLTEVQLTEEERLYGWFQQDSATAHTACMPMQGLSDVFGDRIISSDIWPAGTPDLNPCDFFFWGCLKNKVYSSNP
jgi:inhibitor of nuclear factor kappa-B kinase subunit alpha